MGLYAAIQDPADRRQFIGGSDARTIMGDDEPALLRLWREKRGEVEPEDLSGNLIVQLGPTNRHLRLLTGSGFRMAHAWPASIFVDELDAGGLNYSLARPRASPKPVANPPQDAGQSDNTDGRFFGKLRLDQPRRPRAARQLSIVIQSTFRPASKCGSSNMIVFGS